MNPMIDRNRLAALAASWPTLIFLTLAPALAAQTEGDPEPIERPEPRITVSEVLVVEERLEGDDPWLAERATTATKIATPRHLTPMAVSAVTARLFEEQDVRVLGDALENIPGVTVTRFGGSTDVFVLRGFESLSSAAVLTDGTLEPEVSLYQTYNLERVEVVRGPTGFLYGGTALAGAVNLVRKRPSLDRGVRFELLGGSHDTLYGSLDVDTLIGERSGFRLNAFGTDTNGYRDGRDGTVWAIHPSLRHRVSDRTRIDIAFELEEADLSSDGGIPLLGGAIPDIPRRRSFQVPGDFSERENLRLHFDLESIVSPRVVVRNKLWWNSLDQTSAGTIVSGAFEIPFFATVVGRALNRLADDQNFLGERFEALLDLGPDDGVRHQVVAGIEAQRQTDTFDFGIFSVPVIDLFAPIETFDPASSQFLGIGAVGDTTTDVIAPYVVDTITLGPRVRLSLGLRFDRIETRDDVTGADFSEDQLSPFAGLVFAPNARWSLYANYGESFDPPSVLVVAEQRAPEEGRQVEVGVKGLFHGGRITADLALYSIDKENIAIADATGFLAQLGDQRSEGLELEVTGRAKSGFHWRLAYGYTDAELVRFTEAVFDPRTFQLFVFDFSGNQPAWVPENVFDAWAGTRLRSGFGIAGGLRWVDSRFTDEDNAVTVGDYLTIDTTLSYTRGGSWTTHLYLKNLTDEDYELRALSPLAVLPADGFNVQAGVDFRF